MTILLKGSGGLSATSAELQLALGEAANFEIGDKVLFDRINEKFVNPKDFYKDYAKSYPTSIFRASESSTGFIIGRWHVTISSGTYGADTTPMRTEAVAVDIEGELPDIVATLNIASNTGGRYAVFSPNAVINDTETEAALFASIEGPTTTTTLLYFKADGTNLFVNGTAMTGTIEVSTGHQLTTTDTGTFAVDDASVTFKSDGNLQLLFNGLEDTATYDVTTNTRGTITTPVNIANSSVLSNNNRAIEHITGDKYLVADRNAGVKLVDLNTDTLLSTLDVAVSAVNSEVFLQKISATEAVLIAISLGGTGKFVKFTYDNDTLVTVESVSQTVAGDIFTILTKEKGNYTLIPSNNVVGDNTPCHNVDLLGSITIESGPEIFGALGSRDYLCVGPYNTTYNKFPHSILTGNYMVSTLTNPDKLLETLGLGWDVGVYYNSPILGVVTEKRESDDVVIINTKGYGLLNPEVNNLEPAGKVINNNVVSINTDFKFISDKVDVINKFGFYTNLEISSNTNNITKFTINEAGIYKLKSYLNKAKYLLTSSNPANTELSPSSEYFIVIVDGALTALRPYSGIDVDIYSDYYSGLIFRRPSGTVEETNYSIKEI